MNSVIITPSYFLDFERCKILCRSVEKYVSSYDRHIIIVDKNDYELFNEIKGPKIEIITKESILPGWLKKIPRTRRWWFSLKTLPVRGWILQQVVKLSVAEFVDADIYFFADSDIMFIRPFDLSSLVKNDKVRLYRFPRLEQDYHEPRHIKWYTYAGKLFQLEGDQYLESDYIGPLVTWRRDTLLKLNNHIQDMSSRKTWKEALCNTITFSEYILYGIFSEFILKEESGHYWDHTEICHTNWTLPIDNLEKLKLFLSTLRPEHCAICVQSNLGIDPGKYSEYIYNYIKE